MNREGVRSLLARKLEPKHVESMPPLSEMIDKIENYCYDNAINKRKYTELYSLALDMIDEKYGEFNEISKYTALANNLITIEKFMDRSIPDNRTLYKELFYNMLYDAEAEDAQELARKIERACYNRTIVKCKELSIPARWTEDKFIVVYGSVCSTVAENLDPAGPVSTYVGYPWTMEKLLSGEFLPENLAKMTSIELCDPASSLERKEIEERQLQKVTARSSAIFRCPKCGKRDHTYRQIQMRSADEPATIMCTCNVCGNNFEGR